MQVMCKQCLAVTDLPPDTDPHTVTWCGCCVIDHHHGEAASGCPREHDGPCWQGPQSGPRPPGCTVCRPVVHFATAGAVEIVSA